MNLENIQFVEMFLRIKEVENGFMIKVDVHQGGQISVLCSDQIFPDRDFALAVGEELIKKAKKDFKLNDCNIH